MIIVRIANSSDAERISSVILETSLECCFGEHEPCPAWYKESVAASEIRKLIGSEDYYWLVALQESEIVGVLSIKNQKHVKYYFVLPGLQGRGVGRELWSEANKRSMFASQVSVRSSINAVAVYERLGFMKTETEAEFDGIRYQPMEAKFG